MNLYWNCQEDTTSLAKYMLDIGKYRGKKDNKKLLSTVNKLKRNIIARDKCVGWQTYCGANSTIIPM